MPEQPDLSKWMRRDAEELKEEAELKKMFGQGKFWDGQKSINGLEPYFSCKFAEWHHNSIFRPRWSRFAKNCSKPRKHSSAPLHNHRAILSFGKQSRRPAYLPKGITWPADPDWTGVVFPRSTQFCGNAATPSVPTQGIVQFFINDDDLYGMDFDDGKIPIRSECYTTPKSHKMKQFANKIPDAAGLRRLVATPPGRIVPTHFCTYKRRWSSSLTTSFTSILAQIFRQFGEKRMGCNGCIWQICAPART